MQCLKNSNFGISRPDCGTANPPEADLLEPQPLGMQHFLRNKHLSLVEILAVEVHFISTQESVAINA